MEQVATPVVGLDQLAEGHHNIVLRFANTTWWFFVAAGGQWFWNYFIWERYFDEPQAQAFLDLMTVAKISIFISDSAYHGWYLHGDAPYAHSDDTMNALSRHLLNEQMSRSIGRGLEAEHPDLQTFQMWLTPAFRAAWHAVNTGSPLQEAAAKTSPPMGSPSSGGPNRGIKPPTLVEAIFGGRGRKNAAAWTGGATQQAVAKARTQRTATMEQVGAFLRTFLTHGYRDAHGLDWDLRFPTIFERLILAPPPYALRTQGAKGKVIFQPDKPWFGGDDGWTAVTFLGHDYELLVHEILTFAVADIWFRNLWLSILLTFLSHHGIRLARALGGESNLSDRTLVDARFLI